MFECFTTPGSDEAKDRQRRGSKGIQQTNVDHRAGVCEYHKQQGAGQVQSTRKRQGNGARADVRPGAQHREVMALWNDREYGDIGQGDRKDEIRKTGHSHGKGNAI